jgi:hypothetical protein
MPILEAQSAGARGYGMFGLVLGAPGAPIIGNATQVANGSINITYTKPNFNGGNAITSYTAVSSPGGLTATINTADSGTINVTGLTLGTQYTFRVYATNGYGNSAFSDATARRISATVPGTPSIGTLTVGSATSILIPYTQPASDGSDTIIKYVATATPGGLTASAFTASSGTINFTGLTAGTAYTFTVYAENSLGAGPASGASTSITPRSYSVTPAISTIGEVTAPITVQFNVATQGVASGTTLYWQLIGGVTGGDFSSGYNGSFTVSGTLANSSGSFTVTASADALTEGAETFQADIRTGSIGGPTVATSSSVSITDQSFSPSYSFGTIPSSINEGDSGTFNVSTSNVANGTILYWSIDYYQTSLADFSSTSGSFTINSNAGSFSVTASADQTSEGTEYFRVALRTDSTVGTIQAYSSYLYINDTSTAPPQLTGFVSLGSNYVASYDGIQYGSYNTKSNYLTITADASAGSGQSWSVSAGAIPVQVGSGAGDGSSGTFSSGQSVVCLFGGPHDAGFVYVTISKSGYTTYSSGAIYVPAISVNSPYTYSNWRSDYGKNDNQYYAGLLIGTYEYRLKTAFYPTGKGTRYGLGRQGDIGGVNYWADACAANGWSYNTQAFVDTFFAAVDGVPGSQDYNESFNPNPRTSNQGDGWNTFGGLP